MNEINNIGIIVAMPEEMDEIIKELNIESKNKIYDIEFMICKKDNKKIILAKSGVGKVNAARTTQILIDQFKVDIVINTGSAGGLDNNLNIGDIVIGDRLVQHDFDATAFGHQKGYISNAGQYFASDENLITKFKICADKIKDKDFKTVIGTIATGDVFCTEIEMKEEIINLFDAKCVEMEGAAIAQVCQLDKIPFIVVRSISDSPNGNNAITFDKFLKLASTRCAKIINQFINEI